MFKWFRGPRGDRRLHLVLLVAWALLIPPTIIWWKDSITFLVFISVYAVIVGHWSAYQAARVEEKQGGDNQT